MGRMRSGVLKETTHEKVERGNGGDATEYREDRRNSFPSERDLRNGPGRSDGKCRPDARRVLPALRLEGPTRLRSFGGPLPRQKRREAGLPPPRPGAQKTLGHTHRLSFPRAQQGPRAPIPPFRSPRLTGKRRRLGTRARSRRVEDLRQEGVVVDGAHKTAPTTSSKRNPYRKFVV